MNAERDYKDYLQDILDSIGKVARFIEGMTCEQFVADEKTVYAVIRALEIIGEATKQIPDSVREQNRQVPWREMAGIRDKLIHSYFGVNLEVVWKTAAEDLPTLEPHIRVLLIESTE